MPLGMQEGQKINMWNWPQNGLFVFVSSVSFKIAFQPHCDDEPGGFPVSSNKLAF